MWLLLVEVKTPISIQLIFLMHSYGTNFYDKKVFKRNSGRGKGGSRFKFRSIKGEEKNYTEGGFATAERMPPTHPVRGCLTTEQLTLNANFVLFSSNLTPADVFTAA
jgi:hypothetical protein